MKVGNIHAWDVVVLVLYLVASLLLGIYTICKRKSNIQHMFLAGRSTNWWLIGFSLFASNIGASNYVGIAGDAAAAGFAVIMFEWNAVWLLVLLGWIFLPVYIASGIYTMPEYIALRFGGKRLRIYLSCVALFIYIFSTISADLYSGAVFINQSLKLNIYAGVAILLAIALVFNGFGGLQTVLITDSLAVVVMIIGGVILCAMGFAKVGGLAALEWKYMHAVPNTTLYGNTTCGYPPHDAWHVFRHPWKSSYPSVGLILRTTFGSLWYWCANQVLVQRTLAAKNITHAKAGCVFAGYLKLLPFFIMVFPGMISRALFPDEVACATAATCMEVCGSEVGCSNIALPKLVIELLPVGLKGLMVASVMAAVVSSLTSIFNSASAIFTLDIWINIRKGASQKEMIIVGRIFVLIMVAISIVWIPVMSEAEGGKVFAYVTTFSGYLGAPTCAMFLLAIFWNRVTEEGAFWGMIIAQAWGLVRLIMDLIYQVPPCEEPDLRPKFLTGFHGYYFIASQIVLAFVAGAVISLLTKEPQKEGLTGLTYWTRYEKPQRDIDRHHQSLSEEVNATMVTPGGTNNETELRKRTNCQEASYKEEEIRHKNKTVTRWLLRVFCGADQQNDNEDYDDDEVEKYATRLASIKQPAFWKTLMDVNAIIMMSVTLFLFGFFY